MVPAKASYSNFEGWYLKNYLIRVKKRLLGLVLGVVQMIYFVCEKNKFLLFYELVVCIHGPANFILWFASQGTNRHSRGSRPVADNKPDKILENIRFFHSQHLSKAWNMNVNMQAVGCTMITESLKKINKPALQAAHRTLLMQLHHLTKSIYPAKPLYLGRKNPPPRPPPKQNQKILGTLEN